MKFNQLNVFISPKARIGKNVKIGDNTRIYDNVVVGDDTIIANDCVLGEPTNAYYQSPETYQNPDTYIGSGSLIRSHTILYAGSTFGEGFSTGHRVTIREKSVFGIHCSVGTLSDIQGYVTFGNYCRLHSNVHIGQQSTIGNFVFIYPYVVFTNDPHPPSNLCIGPTVGDYTQIAVASILLPGVIVGSNCLVGANSVVSRNVDDYALVAGNPAKQLADIRSISSRELPDTKHYPWMYHFDRGMPWQEIGFDAWQQQQVSPQ